MVNKEGYLPIIVMISENCFFVFMLLALNTLWLVMLMERHISGAQFMMPNAKTVQSGELQLCYKLLSFTEL